MRVLFLLGFSMLLAACGQSSTTEVQRISGSTMGTQYHLAWFGGDSISSQTLQAQVDERLVAINRSMSTYDSSSELSLLNQGKLPADADGWIELSDDLTQVLGISLELYEKSQGGFEVTIGPLVNLWGFGPEARTEHAPAQAEIEQRLVDIGSDKLELDQAAHKIRLKSPQYIDLSAVAKGWAVDEIAKILEQNGISSYMVEIGGEIRAQGHKANDQPWRIAIERPDFDRNQGVALIVPLDGQGVATSGSYRNYFEDQGQRYSHTIDPRTGYPIQHKLASVTVIHPSTGYADAWATAITVAGPEQGMALAERYGLALFMLVGEQNGFKELYSSAFRQQFPQVEGGGK